MKEWQGHKGASLDSKDGFDVIDCEICKFKHIIPIPTPEELMQVYQDDYYKTEKPLYIERVCEDIEWWNTVFADKYDTFEQYLPAQRRRILDVGSGPGIFLAYGKQRGWQTVGIEPSKQAAKYSREELKLEIIEDFLSENNVDQLGKYDVVHMSTVLEHIPDPRAMVKLAYKLLADKGIICISVPNDYSPFQQVARDVCGLNPWWVAPPHHINYFDRKSLETLLKDCGFNVLLSETTFPIDMFLLMGQNYIGNDQLGRQCHTQRMNFEKNLEKAGLNELKRKLFRDFSKYDIGREVIIFAQKY
jgi:SAM-dependent methyltransferase